MPTNKSLFLDFPPEDNLNPDGNPLVTPEELEIGPSIPVQSSEDPNTPDRLCEYDIEFQRDCRRTQTVFSLEAEYDTFAHPEMNWGVWDEFCIHEGHYYYEKTFLNKNFNEDQKNKEASKPVSESQIPYLEAFIDAVGFDIYNDPQINIDNFNLPQINFVDVITKDYAGFPAFVDQTLSFYRTESVGEEEITLDTMTREVLDALQEAFGDENPLLSNMARGIYYKDGKAYYAGVLGWNNNPNVKLGIYMSSGAPSEKYPDSENTAYFFAFEQLTDEQHNIVKGLHSLYDDDNNIKLEIIYL